MRRISRRNAQSVNLLAQRALRRNAASTERMSDEGSTFLLFASALMASRCSMVVRKPTITS